jgi:hypothetical protein
LIYRIIDEAIAIMKLPDIKTKNQIKWHKNTMMKELTKSRQVNIGFANEIRLERIFELLDWYVENVGAPVEIVSKNDDLK